MHASTIERHQKLVQDARDLADAWRGTDPMTSEFQVRSALLHTLPDEPVEELLLYLVDACREAGLLVLPTCTVCGRSGHESLGVGYQEFCPVNRAAARQ